MDRKLMWSVIRVSRTMFLRQRVPAISACCFSTSPKTFEIFPTNESEFKRGHGKRTIRKYASHFYDKLRIHVKGGSGGKGIVQRGGTGGNGGDIIVVGKEDVTLKDVVKKFPTKRFTSEKGSDSRFFCLIGEQGKPTIIEVPLGVTVISEEGHKMGEVNAVNDKVVIAKGGDGGSEINGYAGCRGQAHCVTLDLKLIADVGFVGFPNAGKSTLLRAISQAKPKIAAYPFTTIRPNIGVIEFEDLRTISLADLPGLIEGAHANIGMGHKFLKHVERTKVLLFIVDLHGFQLGPNYPVRSALETILLLNRELELYRSDLAEKPAILVLNKFDLPDSVERAAEVEEAFSKDEVLENAIRSMSFECRPEKLVKFDKIISISAAKDRDSVNELKNVIRSVIDVNDDLKTFEVRKLKSRVP